MRRPAKTIPLLAAASAIALGSAAAWLHMSDYLPLVEPALKRAALEWDSMADVDNSEAKLLFCGTGSPATTPERGSPCLALIFNGKLFLFDAGEGSVQKLRQFKMPLLKLSMIFVTHPHSDHISGVAQVMHASWLDGRDKQVILAGPPGMEDFIEGTKQAYGADIEERMHTLAVDGYDARLAFGEAREIVISDETIQTVHTEPGLKVEAFRVNHPDWHFAYGYRLTVAGKTIVISGDTTPSDGIRKYAADADILIHEAINMAFSSTFSEALRETRFPVTDNRISAIANTHTSTLDLAALAEEAGARSLYLTHLIPPIPDSYPARKAFTSGMDSVYDGPITVASDGLEIDLRAMD